MTLNLVGSAIAILGVVVLLYGAHVANNRNTDEHNAIQEHVDSEIKTVRSDVGVLRAETRQGFETLSAQIATIGESRSGQ